MNIIRAVRTGMCFMKDFQGLLMLSGLDSVITGGYLTTRGREISDDDAFLSRLEDF